MSDVIQLLPDSVANQIAAGEVIQRPASVIKELVENAVDAKAKTIQVAVVDAGRTLIQVIDDGVGMSETDARLAFERHATSKIRKADDLFALQTMGFRGEALPSIAAVAQVQLKTRTANDEVGTRLQISGGKIIGQEPQACPVGSNFAVENLFFNVPARRKFLKSNTTELNNIMVAFERIALVYPHIAFTLRSNDVETYNLRAASLRQRIVDVFGKRINQDLLPVNVDTTVCRISGFVGKPEAAKKKNTHQYFFVNGRYMKHPYFHKAVMNAYERLIPAGEQIPYFIYFEVDAGNIDVNIHPTKTEIKFENEQTIWQILAATVREAIGKFNSIPSIDFDTAGRPNIPVYDGNHSAVTAPTVDYDPHYNPFNQAGVTQRKAVPTDWEKLYEGLSNREMPMQNQPANMFGMSEPTTKQDIIADRSPSHYQYKGMYIMTAVKSGLMIIDQHRAHVRILYEEYQRLLSQHGGHPQKMLFPEMLQFPPSDDVVLQHIMPDLEHLGFELTSLGNGSYAVQGVPAGLEGLNTLALLQEMVASSVEHGSKMVDDIHHSLALCLAQHAAIPQGQVLGNDEMENLINRLFACENVNYTPNGKPILCILRQSEIDDRLK